jgi:hypothetical protein
VGKKERGRESDVQKEAVRVKPEDREENAGRCLCPGCPTHDDCMTGKGEKLYCSRGKTQCELSAKGCLCGECPVWSEYGLDSHYFCLRGAAV